MTKTFVYPYGYSNSAKSLSKSLKQNRSGFVGVIKRENSSFKPSRDKLVINWGSYDKNISAYSKGCTVLNTPEVVRLAACKIKFFNTVKDACSIPEFTTDPEVAQQWVLEGHEVVGRQSSTESGGKGIVLSSDDPDGRFFNCVLWTKYIPKKQEFRVHVFQGRVLDVQQKKLRETDQNGNPVDRDSVNWKVRSYSNGFIFAREGIQVPESVTQEALNAFNALPGLDFGAFDVIFNQKRNQAYVLECNTAPGLEGTTLERYTEAFQNV